MSFSLLSRARAGSGKTPTNYFRPRVEGLEDRVTPATMNLPLAVESVGEGANGALQAVVTFAGQQAGTATITKADLTRVADNPATQAVECSVLHLQLAPINLQLLGLHVDTSAICLDVTATEGGGLLGNLLCDLSDGLNVGGILNILDQLDNVTGQIGGLLGQLDNLLGGVLGQQLTVDQIFQDGGAEDICTGDCEILDLSLGPVDLSLLGLNVSLDDCADGPVQVCVSATASEGLLGSLLCGVADGGLGGGALGGLLGRIDNLIDRLGDLADRLDGLPNAGKLAQRVDKLVDQLEKVVDRVDSLKDLDHLIKRVEHTVDQLDRLIDRIA